MTSNSYPSLWDLNKASVFVDAMSQANGRTNDRSQHVCTPVRKPRPAGTPLSSRIAVASVGLVAIIGFAAVNWLA